MHYTGWALWACLFIFISAAGCVKEKKEAAPIRLSDRLGTVSLNQRGKDAPVGTILKIGDRLFTGEKSMATLLMPDNSMIRVFEESEFRIIKMESAGDGGVDTRLAVDRGRSMFVIEKLARGGKLSVITPTAVAAVRGTTFTVEVKDTKAITDLKVLRGSVYIEAKDEALVNSLVKDGEMIALSSTAVVDDKKPIPEKRLEELKEEEKAFIRDSDEPVQEAKKEVAPDKATPAPPVLKSEAAIKEYYHKLEEVNMDDGTILIGAVIFQNDKVAKIHTASGIIQVPTSAIRTIRMK